MGIPVVVTIAAVLPLHFSLYIYPFFLTKTKLRQTASSAQLVSAVPGFDQAIAVSLNRQHGLQSQVVFTSNIKIFLPIHHWTSILMDYASI